MSQFFGQQQLAAQYFRPQYLHGAGGTPTQDGRSGYWRLFYYQLQEEELKRHEQKQRQEEAQREGKNTGKTAANSASTTAPSTAGATARPRPRVTPRPKTSNTQEIPVFKPKPLYLVPKRQEQMDVAPLLKSVSDDLHAWALHSQELSVQFAIAEKQKELDRTFQSANDDQEVIMWLLLAA